jgi:hypothetical protein
VLNSRDSKVEVLRGTCLEFGPDVSKEDRIYIFEDANTSKELVDEFDEAEHPFANQIASIDTNVSLFALKMYGSASLCS